MRGLISQPPHYALKIFMTVRWLGFDHIPTLFCLYCFIKKASAERMSQPPKITGATIQPVQPSHALRKKFHIPWNKQRKIWAYIFISVPFLYFLIVNFGAMLAAFSYSFQEYNTLSSVHKFVGLDNYTGIFG